MKVIRKIWIGSTIKGADTMSWEVGQKVSLGPRGQAVVDHIIKDEEGCHVYVKKDDLIFPWKTSDTVAAIEYNVDY